MGQVNLSVEEYNKLYQEINYYDDCNFVFVKVKEDTVFLVSDPENGYIIASLRADTKEGKILSNFTNCFIEVFMDDYEDDKTIELYHGCEYCDYGMECKLTTEEKEQIEKIQFVDPIPNRINKMLERLKLWKRYIKDLKEKWELKNVDSEIQKINKTTTLLEKQLNELLDKWEYENKEKREHI